MSQDAKYRIWSMDISGTWKSTLPMLFDDLNYSLMNFGYEPGSMVVTKTLIPKKGWYVATEDA